MTRNKRYEAQVDALQDARIRDAATRPQPVTLPMQAYGPNPIEWATESRPVCAWVQWADHPAERMPVYAKGWNDGVVIVEWNEIGGTRSAVVWRQACRLRRRS